MNDVMYYITLGAGHVLIVVGAFQLATGLGLVAAGLCLGWWAVEAID